MKEYEFFDRGKFTSFTDEDCEFSVDLVNNKLELVVKKGGEEYSKEKFSNPAKVNRVLYSIEHHCKSILYLRKIKVVVDDNGTITKI